MRNEINKYKIVSFDIFDTLILRKVYQPDDIFKLVEKIYSEKYDTLYFNFFEKRKLAEHNMRLQSEVIESGREINFDEIYDTLQNETGISDQAKEQLKSIECQVEIDNCIPNKYIEKIYKEAINQGKKIYIISDIYHSKEFISKILTNCGYTDYSALYVSSAFRRYKATGLFEIFLKHEKIDAKEIIHIGDNFSADIMGAKKAGLNTYYYEKSSTFAQQQQDFNSLTNFLENINDIQKSFFLASIINNIYANRNISYDKDFFWYNFGYSRAGIYLLGFTKWLVDKFQLNNYDVKLFALRDGEIINKVYLSLNQNTQNNILFECSRKVLNFISIETINDIFEFYDFTNLSLKEVFNRLKCDNFILNLQIKNYGFDDFDYIVKSKEDISKLRKILSENFDDIKKEILKDREVFYCYLESLNLKYTSTIALVDISWSGTILKRVRRLMELSKGRFNTKIHGYFIGTFHDLDNTYGYLFENPITKDSLNVKVVTDFFELYDQVFTMDRGSLLKYELNQNGTVDFIYDKNILVTSNVICNIHHGILDFVNHFIKYTNNGSISKELAISPWYQLVSNPTLEQASIVGALHYDSMGYGETKYMRKLAYKGNLFNFMTSYNNSFWKQGHYKLSTKEVKLMYRITTLLNKIKKKVGIKIKSYLKKSYSTQINDANDMYSIFKNICLNNKIYISEKNLDIDIYIYILHNNRNTGFLYDTLDKLGQVNHSNKIKLYISTLEGELLKLDNYINFKSIEIVENISQNELLLMFSTINSLNNGYIMLMNRGDFLLSNVLDYCMENNLFNKKDLIYFDECEFDVDYNLIKINFKPDFSFEMAYSQNYIDNACLINIEKIKKLFIDETILNSALMHYMVITFAEENFQIAHIDQPIYAARNIDSNNSRINFNENYKIEDSKYNVEYFFKNFKNSVICVEPEYISNSLRIFYPIEGSPLISIIIPFKDKVELLECCISSILSKTTYLNYEIIGISNNSIEEETYECMKKFEQMDSRVKFYQYNEEFNYSKINNYAVHNYAKGEHIILLNNDTKIITPNWIEELLRFSQQENVGIVGAKMYYEDNTIEHAGIAVGLKGYLSHLHRFFHKNEAGYFGRLQLVQNFTSLMAACMMIKTSLYKKLNGLDEINLTIAYNDIDMCLRAHKLGNRNVFTPYCELYHYESKSRGYLDSPEKREREYKELIYTKTLHKDLFERDPFYNINLPFDRDDFGLK